MNYSEAIAKIHEFTRFGSVLGLERMERLMALLGDPQDKVRTIHIAGTNGKGSVSRYIASMLRQAGYRTGLYTSPYLERFTERMEIDGCEISETDLAFYAGQVFEKVEEMTTAGFDSPTEFEVVTAIGFCYYADRQVDFLVLEVGMGGTGDSTNIIKRPEIAVITSISFDHTDYLGDTLPEIAAEKAGIIKDGVPVVLAVADDGAKAVIRAKAERCGSLWHDTSEDPVSCVVCNIYGSRFNVRIGDKYYESVEISMSGMHQVENAVCAMAAIEVLRTRERVLMEDKAVYQGMKMAKQTGRMEILRTEPYFILDGAHNEAGAKALAEMIKMHFSGKKILLVTGMLIDKKVEEILDILLPCVDSVLATEPDNPRKLDAERLRSMIIDRGMECVAVDSAEAAVKYAELQKARYDVILFTGSLYLIGKVRSVLNETI